MTSSIPILKPILTLAQAEAIAGTLGEPSKMPGYSYGLSARACAVGSKLRHVPDSVCSKCYALKGRYVVTSVTKAHARRLASLTHPQWVDALVFMIQRRGERHFRWHDSGDIQNLPHLMNIVEVCRRTPETEHWLPTRERGFVGQYRSLFGCFPDNLCVRLSATMIGGAPPAYAGPTSTVVTSKPSCPSSKQDNKCGSCRACWDQNVKNVSYLAH